MALALLAGFVTGLGVWMLIAHAAPAKRPLAVAIADLYRAPERSVAIDDVHEKVGRVAALALPLVTGRLSAKTVTDLQITETPLPVFAAKKMTYAVVGLLYPVFLAEVVSALGTHVPIVVPVWAALIFAIIGWSLPDRAVRSGAESARIEVRSGLTIYLDLLVLLIASGEGPIGATELAARAGDSKLFRHLQATMHQCRLQSQPVYEAFEILGSRWGVASLQDLANSARLAAGEGSRLRDSLLAKARSMRIETLTAEESEAERASAKMSIPILVITFAFLVFLGYPAVNQLFKL